MVNDKDVSAVLEILPQDAHYYFTQAQIARALSASELMQRAANFTLNGNVYPTVKEAINAALTDANLDDLIFIGGSNFIVGEALPCF
jgi:dihydrofolate synthase/folylpolyglutamate synthase